MKGLSVLPLPFDRGFAEKHESCEHYVALHSSAFYDLFGWDEDGDNYEALVKIVNPKNPCHPVYRRAIGYATTSLDKQQAMLGHRTRKELKATGDADLTIKGACWFCYLWHHVDVVVRWPFRCTVGFGIVSMILNIISLILNFLML